MLKNILLFCLRWLKGLNTPSKIIDFSLKRYKYRVFLIQPDKNLEYTFRDLEERVKRIISFLYKTGINRADVLAFISYNSFEYFELRAAAHLGNFVFFPIPISLSEEDIIYFLNKSDAKVVFYRDSNNFNLDKVKEKTQIKYFVNLDSQLYNEIFHKRINSFKIISKRCNLATLNLSSGTTQKTPKIVKLTDKNWTASLYNYILNSDIKPNKKIVFLCTLSFLTAGSTTFLPSILAGVTNIIIKEDFSLENLVDYIKRYRVNRLYITPSWFLELFEWCRKNREHFSSLENIILGTERVSSLRLKEAIEFFGPIISVGYGMVEVLPPISMLSGKDYYFKGRLRDDLLGSAGRIIRGVKVKILDDSFKELPPGNIGKLAIKSKTVSKGYLDNVEDNLNCFRDGWFYTNDYGFVDKEGFLYILGREEEILTRERRLIFAREIEDRLYELPFINRCLVLSENKCIFLFVSLRQQLNTEEVKRKILEKVKDSPFRGQSPSIIIKESLPINPSGKLDRRGLSEEIL